MEGKPWQCNDEWLGRLQAGDGGKCERLLGPTHQIMVNPGKTSEDMIGSQPRLHAPLPPMDAVFVHACQRRRILNNAAAGLARAKTLSATDADAPEPRALHLFSTRTDNG
ncbi:unnamed protein product, partial [Ectocarpus sp. 12 AP-2014]